MAFILRGQLTARSCDDCSISLRDTVVRVYPAQADAGLEERAAADPRHTFRLLHHAAAPDAPPRALLLGEGMVDSSGSYSVVLAEGYDGSALDVDLYCGTINGHVPPRPGQLVLTTLQPQWRTSGVVADAPMVAAGSQGSGRSAGVATLDVATADRTAAFNFELPPRLTCAALASVGLWVVCGQVTVCGTKRMVAGVTVSAFDRDWLQDDALGSAVTDSSGRFEIWYTAADFSKTPFSPWLNIELVPGPDLYFKVTSSGGATLLAEPPDTGRQPSRRDVGPCCCVELCIPVQPPQNEPVPDFRYIGGIDYQTGVDSAPTGSGRTIADDRAFFAGLRLNGPIGTTLGGLPLEYRFEVQALPPAPSPPGPWLPVVGSQILATTIGTWEQLSGTTLTVLPVVVDPAAAPSTTVVVPDAGGWIAMPQDDNLFTGLFTPDLNMITLDTTTVATWSPIDTGSISAGASTAPAGLANDQAFGIRMRVRQVGNPGSETDGGTCRRLAIDNTRYDHVNKGGSWTPTQVSDQLGVASVDIEQLVTQGCAGISSDLTVLFTAAHPNLGSVSLTMSGPGGPYGFNVPPVAGGQDFGVATNSFVVATLPTCAYLITLTADILLTTGDGVPGPIYDQIAFCKG